jgi:hypothetical protein
MSEEQGRYKNPSLLLPGLGLLALAAVACIWFVPAQEEEEEPEGERVLYWHCPNCGLEMTCPPREGAKVTPCPHCARQGVNFEVQDHPQGKGGPPPGLDGRLLPKVMLSVLVFLVAALLAFGRLRPSSRAPREVLVSSVACPAYGHRMSYREAQANTSGTCTVCEETFVYPPVKTRAAVCKEQQEVSRWMEAMRKRGKPS